MRQLIELCVDIAYAFRDAADQEIQDQKRHKNRSAANQQDADFRVLHDLNGFRRVKVTSQDGANPALFVPDRDICGYQVTGFRMVDILLNMLFPFKNRLKLTVRILKQIADRRLAVRLICIHAVAHLPAVRRQRIQIRHPARLLHLTQAA